MKLTKATTIFYLFTCPYFIHLLWSMVARSSIRNKWNTFVKTNESVESGAGNRKENDPDIHGLLRNLTDF